ncbi:MAG: nucleotidyl transferase AbiEii/AbiGii toxin family protein [Nitrosospira sp.]|nr:nucleotidyl transferase AbiEii/AbiGii toxin family protein [Nitrosospira sp.]
MVKYAMRTWSPELHILPRGQRLLWNRLAATPKHFVLYGGTALALRLGHRESVDFDFFSHHAFSPLELARTIPYLENQTITQQEPDTLSCSVETVAETVKVSFFGNLRLAQIDPPDRVGSNLIAVASLRDLFGMKCATIPQRSEAKDYLDIHALINDAGVNLAQGIACAQAIYGRQYNPMMTLQALSYFADLQDPLPPAVEADLLAAVKSVAVDKLPTIAASGHIGNDC